MILVWYLAPTMRITHEEPNPTGIATIDIKEISINPMVEQNAVVTVQVGAKQQPPIVRDSFNRDSLKEVSLSDSV